MLDLLQQDRLESLLTALVGVQGQSEKAHAIELINFLEQNFEVEATCFAVAKASYHQQAFGETPGTKELLNWAGNQLSDMDFNKALNFLLID